MRMRTLFGFRFHKLAWAMCLGLLIVTARVTAAAPTISSISPTTQHRSGYLEILGSGFGSGGEVLIDALPAPVADWMDTRVVAYVPEASHLNSVRVLVVTGGVASNLATLDVTDRVPGGRVRWRLRMEGPYSRVRPVRGSDGTIYTVDVESRLYAISSAGALKWLVRGAGNKGVAVGSDGTIYTASENDIKAFNTDGSLKWTFVQNPRAFILVGMNIGPDGNIYAVASSGMGVFSLQPDGGERWRTPEQYSRPIITYGEIVFGPNRGKDQLYFYANRHTRAVGLESGSSIFTINPTGQPIVSPFDGSMHAKAAAYSPDGQLLWQFIFPVSGVPVSDPDIGADGTHYVVNRSFELYALNPDGTEKWNLTLPAYVGPPNVDPANSLLVLGSNNTLNFPGFIQAISNSSRKMLWNVDLPTEEPTIYNPWTGQYGFNHFIDTRATFSNDGQTVYLITAIAPGGLVPDRSFLYAIDTGSGSTPPPPPASSRLRSTDVKMSAREKRGVVTVTAAVTVKDESDSAASDAIVNVSWSLPGGSTRRDSGTTDRKGVVKFNVTGGSGTYSLSVVDLSKGGYTFDKANSVLSGSITK